MQNLAEKMIKMFWEALDYSLDILISDKTITMDTTIKELLDIAAKKIK